MADWQKKQFQDATYWFNLTAPEHRVEQELSEADIYAVRAFKLLSARGHGRERALARAAECSGVNEYRLKFLIDEKKDLVNVVVRLTINKRLHPRVNSVTRKKYQRRPKS